MWPLQELNLVKVTKADLVKTIIDQNLMLLRAQDREIGLTQELNSIKAGNDRQELIIELALIKSSVAYKISRGLTAPLRATSFVFTKFETLAWRAARKIKRMLTKRT